MRILITGGAGFVGSHLGNVFIQVLFRTSCNDISNAFKMYRRSVIAGIQSLFAQHFNLTVELPLKSIGRGYRYAVVPKYLDQSEAGRVQIPAASRETCEAGPASRGIKLLDHYLDKNYRRVAASGDVAIWLAKGETPIVTGPIDRCDAAP